MLYTVKEVSTLSNVTIKTLHHYHKIGLLLPRQISESGYRLYGQQELEKLQEILFYRELDLSLEQIKRLLEREVDRPKILVEQQAMLRQKARRLERVMKTLEQSIQAMEAGVTMDQKEMFAGFASEKEWREALREQRDYLQETYQVDLDTREIDVTRMNEQAQEAVAFMTEMANALKSGVKHSDKRVHEAIRRHLEFLGKHGHAVTPRGFADQTRFFLQDDFHLQMLEGQQTGLAYYLSAAAESFASA
ncbi:MerR family transcriptional regulator [Brevibacillus brevis]|uniref:MerR family transcriptional regulator n=1 Tax=Brevibacillus brevis TaxID=1393 RepID=A0ABY9TBB0_BREBE|nr:MerR family transcriptional regulator [Brevibacillus brevis]WNC17380.1 MerR family transcriptional regulator [Brevibacillus brevis]